LEPPLLHDFNRGRGIPVRELLHIETIKPSFERLRRRFVRNQTQFDRNKPSVVLIKPKFDRIKPFPVEIKPSIETIKPRVDADKPSFDAINREPVLLPSPAVRIKPSVVRHNLASVRELPALERKPLSCLVLLWGDRLHGIATFTRSWFRRSVQYT